MKKIWMLPTVILVMNCLMLSASAQDTKTDNKLKIEFGIGMNFSGPQQQMADLMKKYRYADTRKIWLKIFKNSKDFIEYPIYSNAGFTTHIAFSYPIAKRSELGFMLNYSGFGEVNGYSSVYGYLDVHLSSLSLMPLYSYELKDYLEIQAGPAVMINSCDKYKSGSPASNEQYTNYSIGLLTALNLKIWDRSVTFGKIGMNYLLTSDTEMGPYTSDAFSDSHLIPESTFNFSHLNFVFVFGFKL